MTPIGIQRIEKRLESIIPLLDMDDYKNRPQQLRSAQLTRALAAYCVKMLGATSDASAAESVTDRYHDRGIDAIYFDAMSSQLLLVQSKWSDGIGWSDMGEFIDGIRRLLQPDWKAFSKNDKIFNRRNEISTALHSSAKIVLITVHHGPRDLDPSVKSRIHELAEQIDGHSGLAQEIHWNQGNLLESLQRESDPPRTDAALYLSNWGEIKEPYHAVYGRIQGEAIASLWKANPHLTHMNLRDYSKSTDVNVAIAKTVNTEPQHFWYFNNGLTIICNSIRAAVYGRLNPELALFHFEGISIVNGAQTTGIVADNMDLIPDALKAKLWIQIRVIAVKSCPEEFEKRVTKFTNLQNAISVQDWVSLDPLQSRIATDFAIEKRRYAFRWGGSTEPTGNQGCTLKEATLALACAETDMWYAVEAKREISTLWDTDSPRYKTLFHANLSARRIWNAVQILRAVDLVMASRESDESPRADMIAVHLQRVVLHLVFQDPSLTGWDSAPSLSDLLPIATSLANKIFEQLRHYVAVHHPNDYLASTAKNLEKCRSLAENALGSIPDPPRIIEADDSTKIKPLAGQRTLFGDDE